MRDFEHIHVYLSSAFMCTAHYILTSCFSACVLLETLQIEDKLRVLEENNEKALNITKKKVKVKYSL